MTAELMNKSVHDLYVQELVHETKAGHIKQDLKAEIGAACALRDRARNVMSGRKQAFTNLAATWDNLEKRKKEGVIIMQPHMDAYASAQKNMEDFTQESARDALRDYATKLIHLADSFLVAIDTEDFSSPNFAQFLNV
jgi:hypothetical protein